MQNLQIESSSFRDPSGVVLDVGGMIYRAVHDSYIKEYNHLMSSGLYGELVRKGLLIPHEEVDLGKFPGLSAYKVIFPTQIRYISYPYEWCFSQLKDAALLTLRIQKIALKYGMMLKDASAYNVQFLDGRPVLIDTLSFAFYSEGSPWPAYRQFCQHFLAPLLLIRYSDGRLNRLMLNFIDGVPLDFAVKLLPFRSFFNYSVFIHIYLQAKMQSMYANKAGEGSVGSVLVSRRALNALVDELLNSMRRLTWRVSKTEWGDYYASTNYVDEASESKCSIIDAYIEQIHVETACDIGANTGVYSRQIAKKCGLVVSADVDFAAVEKNYCYNRQQNLQNILPLLVNFVEPTPAIGWACEERKSFFERSNFDLVLALAFIHHMVIGNNVPFHKVAEVLARLCRCLIIEFVPKIDSQVKRLLASREDIFKSYDQSNFEAAFSRFFDIVDMEKIKSSHRIIYLMRNKALAH